MQWPCSIGTPGFARLISPCFQLPLECNGLAGVCVNIRSSYAYHDRCIGICAVPGMVAQTVGHHPALVTGSRHDLAAGAHTESINTASIYLLR